MSNPKALRTAIVGCHRSVTTELRAHNFASYFAAVPETSIEAVFDLGAETRREFLESWGDMASHSDYAQMLSQVRPDIVAIGASQKMHADMVELAIEHGVKGILVDKPLVTSMEEADRIVGACRSSGTPFAFALDRRWWPRYEIIRDELGNGIIGDILSVAHIGLPNIINHGSHAYDALLMILGDPEPTWVSGFVEDLSDEPADSRKRLDPSGQAQIGFADGTSAWIVKGHASLSFNYHIRGSEGQMVVFDDGSNAFVWKQAKDEAEPTQLQPLNIPLAEEGWPSGPAMVRDLVAAINGDGSPNCNIECARRTTEIGFAIHESSEQNGARVPIPLENRSRRIPSFPWGNE